MEAHSRKLLFHGPPSSDSTTPANRSDLSSTGDSTEAGKGGRSFDSFEANVIMVLAVLLCAMIGALAVNFVVRCVLRVASRAWLEPEPAGPLGGRADAQARRKDAVKAMPVLVYSRGLALPRAGPDCAICLSEFRPGEHVRVLPRCDHGFHVRCIDRWLASQPSCPTCRQRLFGACHVVFGCGEVSQAGPAPAAVVPVNAEDPTHECEDG